VTDLVRVYIPELISHYCQIILKRSIFDSDKLLTPEQKKRRAAHIAAHPRDIPIPLDDLEPQVYIPYSKDSNFQGTPWHVQIHRDSFSYGEVGPTVDPRLVVDLRFFGRSDVSKDNKVYFCNDPIDGWNEGITDIYGMPQPTV
jgi:pyranose oxidase